MSAATAELARELWREHGPRQAQQVVAGYWLLLLRARLEAAEQEWKLAYAKYTLVMSVEQAAFAHGCYEEDDLLRAVLRRAQEAERQALWHKYEVMVAVNAESCRVRQAVIERNRARLDQISQLHTTRAAALCAAQKDLARRRAELRLPPASAPSSVLPEASPGSGLG